MELGSSTYGFNALLRPDRFSGSVQGWNTFKQEVLNFLEIINPDMSSSLEIMNGKNQHHRSIQQTPLPWPRHVGFTRSCWRCARLVQLSEIWFHRRARLWLGTDTHLGIVYSRSTNLQQLQDG